jgi:citrate synthase
MEGDGGPRDDWTLVRIASTLAHRVNLDQHRQYMCSASARRPSSRPPQTPRSSGELLSADAAAAQLGVQKATLYAYVSRGLLTAVPDPHEPRCSRYPAFEVEQLQQRGPRARGKAAPGAENTLFEGRPLVDTALSGVVDGVLVIRGRPLVAWARAASLEDTAALLWGTSARAAFGPEAPAMPALWHSTAAGLRQADPVARAVALWGLGMPQLRGDAQLQGDELAAALGQHLRLAFACWLLQPPSAAPLHVQVARAWRLPARHHEALRQALVLCADVMTNVMALSGRMMASMQGSLAACLLATMGYGFVRLSGGEFEAVEALFDEVEAAGSLRRVADSYRARGEILPGFNHHLFVQGDPRAAALVDLAGSLGSKAARWQLASAEGHVMHPTLDFGMVALRRALKAPRHGALALVHMARSVGMLAQALEQRLHGRRMWVQSRYVGPSLPAAPSAAPHSSSS